MPPMAQAVVRRLDEVRQRWWIFTLLTSLVLAASASLAVLLVFMLLDALFTFSQWILGILFLVWTGITLGMAWMVIRRMIRSQRTLEATARRIEAEFPEIGSDLINLVQLAEDRKNDNRAFCEAAVKQAAARVSGIPFEKAAEKETRWERFRCCMQTARDLAEASALLGVLIGLAFLCHLMIPNWGSAGNRLMSPWKFVPAVGRVKILEVQPGDTELLIGSNLTVTAKISNPDGQPQPAQLLVTYEGEKQETSLPMLPDPDAKPPHTLYRGTVPSVMKPLQYRLEIGDSQSTIYTVKLCEKPAIQEVQVRLRYPSYLRRPDAVLEQRHADLEAPQYTEAELRVRPSAPIQRGWIQLEGKEYSGRVEQGEKGQELVISKLPLIRDTSFTIHLANAGGADPNPRVNRIRVIPDKPPSVEILRPARESRAAPGDSVEVLIRASDDYGIGRIRLETFLIDAQLAEQAEPAQTTSSESGQSESGEKETPAPAAKRQLRPSPIEPKTWLKERDFKPGNVVTVPYRLELPADKLKTGQVLILRATVADERMVTDWGLNLMPQEATSAEHKILLIDEAARTQEALAQLDQLRNKIWKILEAQIRARMRTTLMMKDEELLARQQAAREVRTVQVEIQKMTTEAAASVTETDKPERQTIKRVLAALAANDMLQAVQQCDGLVKLQTLEAFATAVPPLQQTQDRIIEALRQLLDVARHAQNEILSEAKKRPGADLPDETKRKLEEIYNKMDEFLKQRKKILEAAEDLAKKPVEDFTEEDKKLLKALAASEDDWSKFMKELHTDLSKLAEQDFANPTLAKELVEIQTEIKMAEDALTKKTADIAVPLEQLGYERAEEIKTNLEKWLPDTPDRERWSQEESLTDADKEAPMAELPGELEDLIGELMEEEEDLFDEMEDVSSSAADSLDKGAGWDVADGPISNMSAKGATGNRLPNTSEMSGRSGEGRQGKSSGEFVGDEAVGKGGRNTPSRLTPDPYVKGQIKDHSKDPTGGATGGGKESGQGGQGLEGPSPKPRSMADMQRLAGKQAELRNKAEGIDLQFQIMNFHRTDLKKLIDMMAQIEEDLRTGRYQNALRQRQVLLEGLRSAKQYVAGEFQVRQDTSENLPGDIQKEILGSMSEPAPAGWEDLIRDYFRRLSETGAPGAQKP